MRRIPLERPRPDGRNDDGGIGARQADVSRILWQVKAQVAPHGGSGLRGKPEFAPGRKNRVAAWWPVDDSLDFVTEGQQYHRIPCGNGSPDGVDVFSLPCHICGAEPCQPHRESAAPWGRAGPIADSQTVGTAASL